MFRTFYQAWARPFVLVLGAFIFVLAVGFLVDRVMIALDLVSHPVYTGLFPPRETFPDLVSNTLDFAASIAGIAITVASILVQLSATRYSSRVIDLFIEDRLNQVVYCVLIITPLHGLWVAYTATGLPYYPTAHLLVFKALTMFSLLLLFPYFNYLFYFLRPENIVNRIQNSVHITQLLHALTPMQLQKLRHDVIGSVTQLSDVVLSSMASSDMHLALLSISSLKSLAADYLEIKQAAPHEWFQVPERAFLGLDESKLQRLSADRTWVEMHCLKQYELVFVQALNRFREVNASIVRRTRDLGMIGIQRGDQKSAELVILFFNTYLRHAMNASDIRTMFHTFYQYRQLAEAFLTPEWREQVKRIAYYFRYYGQQSEGRGLTFAMEIAAYDLRIMVESAFLHDPPVVDDLLEVFLEVDRVPETSESEKSQRGVRKNQAILAAFFLAHDRRDLARKIFDDMHAEAIDRVTSIARELEGYSSEDFWEIQDRGSNFYYVPPEYQVHLKEFFSWFTARST